MFLFFLKNKQSNHNPFHFNSHQINNKKPSKISMFPIFLQCWIRWFLLLLSYTLQLVSSNSPASSAANPLPKPDSDSTYVNSLFIFQSPNSYSCSTKAPPSIRISEPPANRSIPSNSSHFLQSPPSKLLLLLSVYLQPTQSPLLHYPFLVSTLHLNHLHSSYQIQFHLHLRYQSDYYCALASPRATTIWDLQLILYIHFLTMHTSP